MIAKSTPLYGLYFLSTCFFSNDANLKNLLAWLGSYYLLQSINKKLLSTRYRSNIRESIAPRQMKLKKTRKERKCSNCSCSINKGQFYGSKSKTVIYDKEGQSFNGGRSWEPLRISKTFIFCKSCAV